MITIAKQEFIERISEILDAVENGETTEITVQGKVIARLAAVNELEQTRKQEIKAFWKDMDQLATEIGAQWKDDMSAVEALRDVRREI